MATDDRLRILGYKARAPSGAWLYWCGECWLVLLGRADFLLPDDPAETQAIMPDDDVPSNVHCMACRRSLRTGEMRD